MLISALASEAAMKRLLLLSVGLLLLTACASPTPVAPVSEPTAVPLVEIYISSPDAVVASAVVEPAQVSNLGFTISALVKEIPVHEGDVVQAGDVLMTLNTPELEYAVIAAEADFNARSQAAQLQKADK
ncbi:MAG: biotin/lipoyl-binding protein, partial [Chloroflexi bacterium]|nr:biotin/lipoyl-binding protein [Chloroflexota bacterium]